MARTFSFLNTRWSSFKTLICKASSICISSRIFTFIFNEGFPLSLIRMSDKSRSDGIIIRKVEDKHCGNSSKPKPHKDILGLQRKKTCMKSHWEEEKNYFPGGVSLEKSWQSDESFSRESLQPHLPNSYCSGVLLFFIFSDQENKGQNLLGPQLFNSSLIFPRRPECDYYPSPKITGCCCQILKLRWVRAVISSSGQPPELWWTNFRLYDPTNICWSMLVCCPQLYGATQPRLRAKQWSRSPKSF